MINGASKSPQERHCLIKLSTLCGTSAGNSSFIYLRRRTEFCTQTLLQKLQTLPAQRSLDTATQGCDLSLPHDTRLILLLLHTSCRDQWDCEEAHSVCTPKPQGWAQEVIAKVTQRTGLSRLQDLRPLKAFQDKTGWN